MTMPEMQKAISNLRILLASTKGKEDELETTRRQFERQLSRAPGNAIHGNMSLDATIGIMDEIQERLDHTNRTLDQLRTIQRRAKDELQALLLTDRIEHAKTELSQLHSSENPSTPENKAKIEELERFIEEASVRAGQTITGEPPDLPQT